MGLRNICMLMSRAKSQHICVPSGSKQHQKDKQKTIEKTCFLDVSILCAVVAFGILIVVEIVAENISKESLLISLVVAAIVSVLTGLCIAECLITQPQCINSIYFCVYQGIGELLAYMLGWTWLLSLCAQLAIICKSLTSCINTAMNYKLSDLLKDLCPPSLDLFSCAFVICICLIVLTGLNSTFWWFVVTMPFVFTLSSTSVALSYVSVDFPSWKNITVESIHVQNVEELLTGTALFSTIFITAHNALRIPTAQVHRKAVRLLSKQNFICLFLFLCQIFLLILAKNSVIHSVSSPSNDLRKDIISALHITSLILLAIESCLPLLTVIEDMASDGLIFRSFSKRWQPFCKLVPALSTHLLAALVSGALALTLREMDILRLIAFGILFVNSCSAVYVISQRYYNEDSWQYAPMLQNSSESFKNGRQKSNSISTEFLPVPPAPKANGVSKVSNESESESSETDIDNVVKEYKEQVHVENFSQLDVPTSDTFVQEPTEVTAFRAKVLIYILVIDYIIVSVLINIGLRTDTITHIAILSIVSSLIFLSIILKTLLQRLPQRRSSSTIKNKPKYRVPFMPWLPGVAALLSLCLIVHLVVDVWHILISWTSVGLFLYLVYGIRNSTAASSFYELPKSVQLELQPLSNVKGSYVTTAIPGQRRKQRKSSRHKV